MSRSVRPRATRLTAVIVAGLMATACGGPAGGGKPTTTPASSAGASAGAAAPSGSAVAESAPDSVWSHLLNRVQPNGQVSLATALAAFAVAIGPVPGAIKPAGVATSIESGTIAVDWVLGHWAQLTGPQRRAVVADLGSVERTANQTDMGSGRATVDDAALAAAPSGSKPPNPNLDCATSDSAGAAPYRAQVAEIRASIAAHIGVPFKDPIYIEVNTKDTDADSLMYSFGCDGNHQEVTGRITGCVVHIEPRQLTPTYSTQDVHDSLVHELTHCFLIEQFGADYDRMPAWYVEGVPEWVESALPGAGGNDDVADAWWITYLRSDTSSLFKRTYSAVGFYAHLEETGTDVWHRILPIGRAFIAGGYSGNAGWNAAGVTPDFLDSWGSGYAEGRYPGTPWLSTGPGLATYQPQLPPVVQLGDDSDVTVKAPAVATALQQVDIDAAIVEVSGGSGASGRISLGGGNDTTLAQAAGVTFCSLASGCACPSASPQAKATFVPIESGIEYASVTGATQPGMVTLTGTSLPTFCSRSTSCLIGSWQTTNETIQPPGIYGKESGGANVKWVIAASGHISIDYAGSSPVHFFGNAITYRGSEAGRISLPKNLAARTGTYAFTDVSSDVTASTAFVTTKINPGDASDFKGTFTCTRNNGLKLTEPIGHGSLQVFTFRRAAG